MMTTHRRCLIASVFLCVLICEQPLAAQVPFEPVVMSKPVLRFIIFSVGLQKRWALLISGTVWLACIGKNAEATYAAKTAVRVAETTFGPNDVRVSTSLKYLAALYASTGRLNEAVASLQHSLAIREKALGREDPAVADDLVSLARLFSKQGRDFDAEPLLQRAVEIREKSLGRSEPALADALDELAGLYTREGKFDEAEPLYQHALDIHVTAGPESPDVADTQNDLAIMYAKQLKYEKAEARYLAALGIRERELGSAGLEVGRTVHELADLYQKQGKQDKAELYLQRALQIQKSADEVKQEPFTKLVSRSLKLSNEAEYSQEVPVARDLIRVAKATYGPEDFRVSAYLDILAAFQWQFDIEFDKAESTFKQALRIQEKTLGTEDPTIAETLYRLALLHHAQLRYGKAESELKRAMRIQEKTLQMEAPEDGLMSNTRGFLAALYEEKHRYEEAESLFQQALQVQENARGPKKPRDFAMARLLSGIAELHVWQGKYAQAEQEYRRVAALDAEAWSGLGFGRVKNAWLAGDLWNLATVLEGRKDAEADQLYQRLLQLNQKSWGVKSAPAAGSISALASHYEREGKYPEAEQLVQKALALDEKRGLLSGAVEEHAKQLAGIFIYEDKCAKAEPLLRRALDIEEKGGDHESLRVAGTWTALARVFFCQGQPKEAQNCFSRSFEILSRQLQERFGYLSETNRFKFIDTVDPWFPEYFSFVKQFQGVNPQLSGTMYNLLLWRKGLVVRSMRLVRQQLEASSDPEVEKQLAIRTEIANASYSSLGDTKLLDETVRKLQAKLDQMEERQAEQEYIHGFAQHRKAVYTNWQQVRDSLGANEAAIEFVSFRFNDGKRWTHTTYYAALVVTRRTTISPQFILLGDADTLECAPMNEYAERVHQTPPCRKRGNDGIFDIPVSPSFYDAFWKPLEPALANVQDIYVSPDGVLNQISLAVIPDDSGQLLLEKYHLRPLLSTGDLLSESNESNKGASTAAVLIGNPLFEIDEPTQLAAARPYHQGQDRGIEQVPAEVQVRIAGLQGGPLDPLPHTKEELQTVYHLLKAKQWNAIPPYEGKDAVVEVVKHAQSPRLLHIATHGDFATDVERKQDLITESHPVFLEDPMLRSGLFFTGANRYRRGQPPPPGMDDGVLTAYEASGLNLKGTELVVLSACETGLGESRSGEGVFGLRRAFQEAGAESILMSMWKVDSEQTRQLMELFYTNWLNGKGKQEALRNAQIELRQRIRDSNFGKDQPNLWGAFVLVGPPESGAKQ